MSSEGNQAESQVLAIMAPAQSLSIGKTVRINGDLSSRKDILINGQISGTIALRENKLEIGQTGHVQANVFARVIVVSGKIMGDLIASEQVIVTKTGQVTGDIYAPDVSIEEGAHIIGNIDMQKKQDVFKPQATPAMLENQSKNSGFGFLFRKRRETGQMLLPDLPDTTQTREEPASEVYDDIQLSANCSLLSETVVIKGEIFSEEDLIIQGHVEGVLYFKNCCLGIGADAEIKGDIFAKTLVHQGRSTGNIYASDQVSIKQPASISGKIFAPRISTEKGARIMGGIEMAPQNIEDLYAKLHGPAIVIEESAGKDEDTGGDVGDSGTQQAAPVKTAWPIFYPRG